MSKLSFDDLKSWHESVKASGSPNGQLSLAEFSSKMQAMDPEGDYSAGQQPDNFIGTMSRGIDTGLQATGLPTLAGNVTGFIGQGADALAGNQDQHYENIARGVGEGLPRMAADVGMMIGGAAMLPTPAAPLGAGLMATGVADAGMKGYADTGSVKQGLSSAGLMALAPGIGSVGSKVGLGVLGKVAPKAIYSGAARVAASQLGQETAFLGADAVDMAINGNEFTMDNIFAAAVGNIGMAPLMIREGMDVYKKTPKRPAAVTTPAAKTWTPSLGADQSVLGGGTNNMARVTNWILQGDDAPLPNMLHEAGGLRQALELTGLDPVGMNSGEMVTALGQRRKAKEVIRGAEVGEQPAGEAARVEFFKSEAEANAALAGFPEGSTVVKTGGETVPGVGPGGGRTKATQTSGEQWRVKAPEQQAVLSAEWEQLTQEAAGLLQTDSGGLVDMLKIIQMANKFQKKTGATVAEPEWSPKLEQEVGEGFDVEIDAAGNPTVKKGKAPKKPKAVKGKKKPEGFVEAEQFELPGTEDTQYSRVGSPLADSEVFRFVKGPITHNGERFLMLGSAQVGASGLMHENKFQSSTQMPKQVFELVKQVYPEAFPDGQNVNVNRLRELEKTRPLVETHVYGQDGQTTPAKAAFNEAVGQLDILGFHLGTNGRLARSGSDLTWDDNNPNITPEIRKWYNQAKQHRDEAKTASGLKATSYYNTISPFDTTEYPVVRVDVTVPWNNKLTVVDKEGTFYVRKNVKNQDQDIGPFTNREQAEVWVQRESKNESLFDKKLWHQDDLHENLPNTLGWAMVQFVPDPRTGETVMFVAEQQSRWGQNVAGQKRKVTSDPQFGGSFREGMLSAIDKNKGHPLLDLQHKLVLKAAMDEARKRGVTKMVVSDGETAMMTEKHDAIVRRPFEGVYATEQMALDKADSLKRVGGENITIEQTVEGWHVKATHGIEQAGGMRQHYDSVLQSAAEKMTRSKGEVVDMGVHKNAIGDLNEADADWNKKVVKGSPVFRNADGTPKATATGKIYNIAPETVENVRYSKLQEPTGADKNGVYTAESLRAETERLNTIEATPDMAVARMKQKVKNRLSGWIGGAKDLMSQAFDSMGLDPRLKEAHMAVAQKIVQMAETNAQYGATPETGNGILGQFDRSGNRVGINTESKLFRNELGGFNLLKTLAHEQTHSLLNLVRDQVHLGIDDFRRKHVNAGLLFAQGLDEGQRSGLIQDTIEALVPKEQRSSPGMKQLVEALGKAGGKTPEEFLTDYSALHLLSKASAEVKRNHLRFLPEPLQNFVKAVYRGVAEVRKAVLGEAGRRGIDVRQLENFHKDIDMLYSKDPVIESMRGAVTRAVQGPSAIEQGDVGGLGIQYSKVNLKAIDEKIAEHLKVRQSGGFVRNVMQHAQISAGAFYKEHFPAYQKLVSALTTMDGMAVSLNHAMRKGFMISVDGGLYKELSSLPDSKLTKEQIQLKSTIGRMEKSPGMQRAAFDAMLKTNELVKQAGELGIEYPTFDHPEVQAKLAGLSDTDKADVRQVYNAYLESNRIAADLQVKGELERYHYVAADYLLGSGVPHYQALAQGKELMHAITSGDPLLMAKWVGNPGAEAFVKHWENTRSKFDAFRANLDRPYFTEFRSGRYGVRYEVLDADGKVTDTGYRSTNDRFQWKAIQRDVAKDQFNRIVDLPDHQKDPKGRFGQMQTRGLEEATNLVRAHYDAAMAAMRPEMAAMFDDAGFDPAQPLVDKVNENLKTMALRRFAPGRENINMIAAQDAYTSLIARKLANTAARLESNWLMKHESWANDKLLKQEMQLFRDNVLSAGRQEFQTFRKATSFVMMGANVSSAMIDSLQPITMGLWRATQEVGTMEALKYTAEGFREAFKPLGKISDKGFKDILVQAINRGLLKTGGSLDNFMSSEDTINYNVVKAQSNRDLVDMKGMLTDSEFLASRVVEQFSKLGQQGMEVGMSPMRLSAQLNNKNALWVGYRMGQKAGHNGQALFDYAVNYMQTTNLSGQRAAHSSFKMKAGLGNGLVEAATLMTNYPIAVFAQMVSSWQGMLKSSGLDSATRARSTQAFAGQVLTQMAFAGVAGMGLKGVFEIAHKMFGVDVEDEVRKASAAIDESGTLGEVLLNGVMNTVTGADLSSRFDLSGLGGLNPYTGFDAKGLFGAGGGMISALYNAPSQFAAGDMSKVQLIPTGFRRMLTANSDEAYQDSSGQQIINPTVAERFTQMIGFKPARMARSLEQKNTMRNISTATSEATTARKSQIMGLMQEGKIPEVMQAIQADVLEEMKGPEYAELTQREMRDAMQSKTRETMMELINYGVEKLLPFDPMATGSGMQAQAMNSSAAGFGQLQAPRQSEATRTVLKQNMMQQLGLKLPRGAPKAIRNAKMVDELIRSNPQLTRSQAIALLQGR